MTAGNGPGNGPGNGQRLPVVVALGSVDPALMTGVLGMALHLVKRFGPLTALVREGRWAERGTAGVGDLDGATLGVIGYGRIGRRTADLGAAFGMRIAAYDPVSEPAAVANPGWHTHRCKEIEHDHLH
jgi:D-3-phosphoglycerate dehydrogenase / 2-oxoglutarate reductase